MTEATLRDTTAQPETAGKGSETWKGSTGEREGFAANACSGQGREGASPPGPGDEALATPDPGSLSEPGVEDQSGTVDPTDLEASKDQLRPRSKRAAATTAAKNLESYMADEETETEACTDGENFSKEDTAANRAKAAGKAPVSGLKVEANGFVAHDAGISNQSKAAHTSLEHPQARTAGLVSLLTNTASRATTPKPTSTLGDLLFQTKGAPGQQRDGLAALAQPGGLAALALAQPSQAAKPVPQAQALKPQEAKPEVLTVEDSKPEQHTLEEPKLDEPKVVEDPVDNLQEADKETSKSTPLVSNGNAGEKTKPPPKAKAPKALKAKKVPNAEAGQAAKAKPEAAAKKTSAKRKQAPAQDSAPVTTATAAAGKASANENATEKPKKRGRVQAAPAAAPAGPTPAGDVPTVARNPQPAVRGRRVARPKGRARGAREETPPSEPDISGESEGDDDNGTADLENSDEEEEEERCDELFGCGGCHWHPHGCMQCRATSPILSRPQNARWKPEEGRFQEGIPVAPTFHPTEEEFADPLQYINKIRPEGEKAGIACIVPPKGWAPPFALDKGTNGQAADSFRFSIRRQPTWQLCMRLPNAKHSSGRKSAAGRYDAMKPDNEDESHVEGATQDGEGEFGFVTLDRTHTLSSFEAYSNWAKCLHFGLRNSQCDEGTKRRRVSSRTEPPSVEEIEAEFWRIIETPTEVVESLYGQDLDSGHHGSGFPLPPFRRRLLEEHLRKSPRPGTDAGDSGSSCDQPFEGIKFTPEEEAYSEHCWNINNLPRCKGSVLRYVIGEELITGVMVPWLYVGSCMSAFCWHIEDHALYSINYLHKGAPKVWYGVPADASDALDQAMRDALPHLFEAAPDLLYQLVTMLSPTQLRERGVPVHRLVHHEGSFVITFPNAYHAGFNTGFNCAEAVNFAPPDWLPWGCSILSKYRRDKKAATLSNDALLVALVKGASAVQDAAHRRTQSVKAELAVEGERVGVKLCITDGDHDVVMDSGEHHTTDPERLASGQNTSTSGRTSVPGQRADTSYLDPIKVEDAPLESVRSAAVELSLRVREERRRRDIGLLRIKPDVQQQRMAGKPSGVDERGVHTNTEDIDCMDCKCDLWLSAVISAKCPGECYCPEHAEQLRCPPEDWILLFRYSLEELDEMLATAEACIGGVEAALAAVVQQQAKPREFKVKNLGPIFQPPTPAATPHSPPPPPPQPQPPSRPTRAAKLKSPKANGKLAAPAAKAAAVKAAPKAAAAKKVAKKPVKKEVKKEAKKEVKKAVKKEEPVEDPYESAELSDSPPPEPKRSRQVQSEEGEWTPTKKKVRIVGKKKVEKEVPLVAPVPPSSPKVKKEQAPQPLSPSDSDKSTPERAPLREKGKGRGKATAKARGKGRTGQGGKKAAKQAPSREEGSPVTVPITVESPLAPGSDGSLASPVVRFGSPPEKSPRAASRPSPAAHSSPLDQQAAQAALWAEVQRLTCSQAVQQGQHQLTGLTQVPGTYLGIQQSVPVASVVQPPGTWDWNNKQTPVVSGTPVAPVQRPPSHSGNSVLMEILKASVQSQPQGGHIAAGSVPLSRAGVAVHGVSGAQPHSLDK